jgi:hypothetical protein
MADRIGALGPARDRLAVRPLATAEEVAAGLDPAGDFWGFYTTPAEARLLRAPADRWREVAEQPWLQELRVFGPDRDLRWQGDRGVALTLSEAGLVGGSGWLQRDRRSRLWGEWLEGTDTWYEERIPEPLRYSGLAPGTAHRYAFLGYREYVQDGVVRYVRYVEVVGGDR